MTRSATPRPPAPRRLTLVTLLNAVPPPAPPPPPSKADPEEIADRPPRHAA